MKLNFKKHTLLLGMVSFVFISAILAFAYITRGSSAAKNGGTAEVKIAQLISDTRDLMRKQADSEQAILQEFSAHAYTLEAPLVLQDPYQTAPLTALVAFKTDKPSQISIHVAGKDALTSIDFRFEGYQTEHWIPVYGLYAGQSTEVTLSAEDEAGQKREKTISLTTEPGIADLPKIDIIVADPDHYQPGFNFVYNQNKPVFDFHGDIRWYLSIRDMANVAYRLNNGRIYITLKSGDLVPAVILEVDLLGKIHSAYYDPYGAHHDLIQVDSDRIYITGARSGPKDEDLLVRLNPQNGKIDQTIDFSTLLDTTRPVMSELADTQEAGDWLHMNAIVNSNQDGTLIVSGRHQSAVVKFDPQSRAIRWILGPHDLWMPSFQKYLLTPIGADFEWNYGQHSPQILPDRDNNPDTIDLLLFDNGMQRSFFSDNAVPLSERSSRMVIYRIDEKAMTVEQLWEWGNDQENGLYCARNGDANLLKNNNVMGVFYIDHGKATGYNVLIEVTPEGEVAFEAQGLFESGVSFYRMDRVAFYSAEDAPINVGSLANDFLDENHQANQ